MYVSSNTHQLKVQNATVWKFEFWFGFQFIFNPNGGFGLVFQKLVL